MAETVADTALLLEVIAGKDPLDPRQDEVPVQPYTQVLDQSIQGLRLGVVKEGFGTPGSQPAVDTKVHAAVNALQDLGAQAEEVSIPAHLEAGGITWALIAEGMTALVYGNGVGYHWKGLYNESLMNTLGKSLKAQAQDLPHQAKFVDLGRQLSEPCLSWPFVRQGPKPTPYPPGRIRSGPRTLRHPGHVHDADDGPSLCSQYGTARLASIRLEYARQHGTI